MVKAKKEYKFEPDYAIPPGDTLEEVLDSMQMSKTELSRRTGITKMSIDRILNGTQPISFETANSLEFVTGIKASFWNNLEAQYREQIVKLKERKRLENHLEWLKQIPTKELMSRKVIPESIDPIETLRNTLKFYGVSTVEAWNEVWERPNVAARRSKCFQSCPGPASAWIRLGELQAKEIECKPHDKDKFKEALAKIKSLTKEDPDIFVLEARRLCAEAGVALTLVPELKKAPWNGATKWLTPDKVMILLSLIKKDEGIFWFSFFHEAGHVLYDNKGDLCINDNTRDDPREIKADKFAADFLIPSEYNTYIQGIRSCDEIYKLANKLGVSSSIVVGRYQHLTKRWNKFNSAKRKLVWA